MTATSAGTMGRSMAAAVLAGGMVMLTAGGSNAADAPRPLECFGGAPTAVVTGEQGPVQATVVGDALYWFAGGDLRRMPLATRVKTSVAQERGTDIKVFDAKLAVGSTNINNLEAIDLPGGKSRVIVEGHTTMEEPLLFSSLALDDKYLYFGRGENQPPFTRSPRIGFHRVRRTGAAAPEFLASAPDGQTTFVVADGFVYWRNFYRVQGSEKLVVELSRRRLQKDARVEVLAPLLRGGRGGLAVHGGRVYFADDDDIRSVPVAGGAAPITHVTIGHQGVRDLMADGACVYWVNAAGALQRARGERGAAERIATVPIGDDSAYPEPAPVLASDGARLYWADPKSGSILALGRSANVVAAAARTIAARPASTQAPRAGGSDRLLVGNGWGCARRSRRAAKQMQCWQVPAVAAADPVIRARPVPWLAADHYAAAADRLCALADKGARCWRPAELFGPAPGDVSFAPMSPHTVYDAELAAGGGVTCTEKDNIWTCAGDDSFGQLGNGNGKETRNRLFGGHIALGAHHGCVAGESVLCWGRNDTLQLGFKSTDTCRVGGRDVACSRGAKPPSFTLPRSPGVYAADTFTCVRRGDVQCWGASRDGLFGTAAACPPELRTAFPTRSGPVAAPNVTCSATPADVPAYPPGRNHTLLFSFAVGPRGACGVLGRTVQCAGAIPTPPDLATEQFGVGVGAALAVSPGDDPSACAVTGGNVMCWGAGYSPAATPNRPVQITFTDVVADGPAVDGAAPGPGGKWAPGCAINDGCPAQAAPPPCPAGLAAEAKTWSAIVGRAGEHAGAQVVVRGPLLVQAGADAAAPSPNQRCAQSEPLPIVMGKDGNPLLVDGLACNGDESRRCCTARAFGQDVIARGKLVASGSRWILRSPQLCTPR